MSGNVGEACSREVEVTGGTHFLNTAQILAFQQAILKKQGLEMGTHFCSGTGLCSLQATSSHQLLQSSEATSQEPLVMLPRAVMIIPAGPHSIVHVPHSSIQHQLLQKLSLAPMSWPGGVFSEFFK